MSNSSETSPKLSPDPSPKRTPGSPTVQLSPARRTRTISESERIRSGPTFYGEITSFCRQKGHGFIKPKDGGDPLFIHISDIESEYVPVEGDVVSYKRITLPPKNDKFSAVQMQVVRLREDVDHERWDSPVAKHGTS